MTHPWDEFTKSLVEESVSRRDSLRRLGFALVGSIFGSLGATTAAARRTSRTPDPCKSFCKCRNKTQQNQCLAACKACNGNTSRLGGSCGKYVCCSVAACKGVCSDLRHNPNCGACGNDCRVYGETCCGTYCADLANDVFNCGGCGNVCDPPGPYEEGACIEGTCLYRCLDGATLCNGICTDLDWDPDNCGACGHVCGGATPYCSSGVCVHSDEPCPGGGTRCFGACTNIVFDTVNCGGCGIICAPGETCSGGVCQLPF
jgi:hypothetical protein